MTSLNILILFPVIGAFCLVFINKRKEGLIKNTALGIGLIEFLITIPLFVNFSSDNTSLQLVQRVSWIRELGIEYYVGIDGISILMVMLTTFIGAISIAASWGINKHIKEYMIALLILETSMIGVFVSMDLFLFYVFWEAMLIPMYFLIGIWGGENRIYASVKFFLYTMFGSVLMLVAILYLYFRYHDLSGEYTFDLLKIYNLQLTAEEQFWLFWAFFLAFAIKVPLFPFHTWLPDAHVEAPTTGSVILAGVLLKMGTYGFLRFNLPLFPDTAVNYAPVICILAVIGIIYGALVAMVQEDIKKLIAYSSVSHLGFVVLGIFSFNIQGIEGGILQMFNHGLSTGALFLLVGMLYDRRHTRKIAAFGGLSKVMPVYATCFMIIVFSSIGLPGLNGFVGEYLILLGSFKFSKIFAVFAASGVILSAVYMLWMFQRVMFLKLDKEENKELKDLDIRERAILIPIIIMVIWIGIYPSTFLNKVHKSVSNLVKELNIKNISKTSNNETNKDFLNNHDNS